MEIKEFLIENEPDIKRKIQILELISAEKRWYTYTEISQSIHASPKTIKNDLGYITEVLPTTWHVKIKKGYGVQVEIPSHASIQEIISFFLKESLTFQILDTLLHDKTAIVSGLSEKLYSQSNKIANIVKKIDHEIRHFGLEIRKKPIRIIGSEAKILYLFTKLYASTYVNGEWPFQQSQDIIHTFIKKIERRLKILFTVDSKHQLSYFIAILVIRKKQGFTIELTNPFSKFNLDTPFYNQVSALVEEAKQDFHLCFSTYEKIILTIVLKSLNYRHIDPIQEKKQEIQIFHQQDIHVYRIVKDFIHMLDERLGSRFIEDEAFIYTLILHFRKTLYLLDIYSYIKPKEEPVNMYIQNKYSRTFFQVKEVYTTWVQKHQIAEYVPNKEIVNIVLQIEASRIQNKSTSKKVLIITKERDCWKNYMIAVLKEKFGGKIEFISFSSAEQVRENELAEAQRIDFVISTIPLRLKTNPVIQIQPILTERDFSNIQYYVNQ
ncbi:BglG family transcription antiterminator [Bacillus thuringiensis]|uniref:PRD domain-containing protein n=1 Tax=Bacillus thuringiensis TaxID=1428 RepID=A0AAW4I317_BACTU|nr:helix-turn-helix domain-containing protein [Bacillus thuringiensis]MBN9901333.1 PRD domain-containing protein [Bacillus thuringiensis]MBN9901346.1 PRD domain-containing protein [Bacillus thuringiensis]MBN9901667.1 PRD domain-containing protein [Bacillus thuringiensis]MBN9901689.1 PRD domain-containing protein [Bacillus thuringiensis]MDY7522288.1 helix-turn-helix domain-containing protein [Bacillus thuringiensis]